MKRRRRKDDGFTLIELMIVIAVIGILAIVLVPKFAGVKTSAKLVGVTTNVHELDTYITSQIGNWNAQATSGNAADAIASAAIIANYAGTSPDASKNMTNPISGQTLIESSVASGTVGKAATDAAIICDSGKTPSSLPAGGVVVTITMDTTNTTQISSVSIQGYDNSSKPYGPAVTVTP
ncbi:prepilin-type N-terminal cleavage/methylation domain protein [Acididesulfobacillus acetoxydans]|uniref:Prepilin-type N-terminal cleavage/methylation domain protein n=1 Tax=Acididesulfobacillus acetoxydans TaxID=1561005 RepID=A0A8S0WG41_9FIRM|nr:type II secretion system protein [Acididesulfobacillus acetoxydans]CAA7601562.1 prepilin-type N-terminal cleavage/methylation domain protein [Acididesulfobacillus acetoxydans]CEJ07049.1 Type IV pilin N-term methylation site GFxxxE [Acididesulfobacillus acetoxydans]